MHRIGDKIIYGASGVMTIVDIREETVADISRSYYVLSPVHAHSGSLTFVPADNERLVSFMRPLLSREEFLAVLHSAKETPPLEWKKESRARQDLFKKITESGDRAAMIAMIIAINECAARREAEGKKNFLSDENAKIKAQRLLCSEIAVVFDMPEENVPAFVKAEMEK